MTDLTAIPITKADGSATDLSNHRGEVMLVVNVASKCGFTPQYEGLEALQRRYGERGFTVLGFPCNQFGAQEPGTNEEIKEFCQKNYGVSFPMAEKISVKGDDIHPLYKYLTEEAAKKGFADPVKWNFTKFLVNEKGELITVIHNKVNPMSEDVLKYLN